MKKYIGLAILLCLLLIGTFFDLQISQWQETVQDNFIIHNFYRFFEIFGEFAMLLIFAFVFGFFANFGFRKRGAIKYIQGILNSIGLISFSIFEFLGFSRYMFPEDGNSHGTIPQELYIVSLILGIILAFIIYKFMSTLKDENYKYYRKVAIASIVYIIILTITINVIKMVWARPRYWMVTSGSAVYHPWYVINGENISSVTNAYMSFPSGHTANAFASVILSFWFIKKQELFYNIFMVWGLLTAVSRIFASQHYLTDTVMAGIISVSLLLFIIKVFKLSSNETN